MTSGLDRDTFLLEERNDRRSDDSSSQDWWERPDLTYRAGALTFAGQDLHALASSRGTPLYVYSAARVREKLQLVHAALDSRGLAHRIFYAMKANRYPPLLQYLRTLGLCGVDVCSPGELLLAREMGFAEGDISFTATSVSNSDLDVLAAHPDVWVNCDSLSSLRRLGERCSGRRVGIRVNPALGIGYGENELLRYAGTRNTKFGIYGADFERALEVAASHDLQVVGLHVHAGSGFLNPQLTNLDPILETILQFVDMSPPLEYVNIGGGLGSPLVAADAQLDLARWANTVARHLGADKRARQQPQIWVEPGDFIVKDAGVLVLEVNTVEEKAGTKFIGVNGGFNIAIEPAFYELPMHAVPCLESDTAPQRVTIAGNINEALDIWAEDALLPEVAEEDLLAFLNGGAYGASMSSNHCMRGTFTEFLLPDPDAVNQSNRESPISN